MKLIDQLIFDTLASRKAVVLSGVGTLSVETKPASVNGKNKINAPRNTVVFKPEEDAGTATATAMLMRTGIDEAQAREQYDTWLANARQDNVISIAEAGTISDGKFQITNKLDKELNQDMPETIVAKPRRSGGITWIILLVLLLLLLAAWLIMRSKGVSFGDMFGGKKQPKVENVIAPPAEPEQVSEPEPAVVIPQTTKSLTMDDGRFHVVAGVFEVPENPDKFIDQLKQQHPTWEFAKYEFKGMTAVTIFAADTFSAARRFRNNTDLNFDMYDIWIYPPQN